MQNENFTNETFTIVDTKDLQIKSLLHFAEGIGYVPVDRTRLSRGFCRLTAFGTYFKSLEGVIDLYNFTTERGYHNLLEVKLVYKVKLQRDKKEPDGVKCQNHMVRLTPRGGELYSHFA